MASGAAVFALASVAAAPAGAAADLPTVRAGVDGSVVRVRVGSTPLESAGGVARVVSDAGSFLVSRPDERTFVAVTATCSHEACLIMGMEKDQYVCDCHGSRFDTSGKLLVGPADTDLLRFETAFSEGTLSIAF